MNNRRSFFSAVAALFTGAAVNSSSIASETEPNLPVEITPLSESGLSQKIRETVIKIIQEECRPGGILNYSMSSSQISQYLTAKNQ